MDPSTAEILNLTTVPLLCAWAGVTDDLSGRIATSLGGPPQHIRHIALTPYKLWDNAIHNIPHTPLQDPEAPVLLRATSIEWGLSPHCAGHHESYSTCRQSKEIKTGETVFTKGKDTLHNILQKVRQQHAEESLW
jgi:hypothetical protein